MIRTMFNDKTSVILLSLQYLKFINHNLRFNFMKRQKNHFHFIINCILSYSFFFTCLSVLLK